MNTNTQDNMMATEAAQTPQRAGFFTNIMPVLGRDGETVYFFLPGEMTVTEHANRMKARVGMKYTPAPKKQQTDAPAGTQAA